MIYYALTILLCFATQAIAGQIEVCAKRSMDQQPIAGADVKCYDNDDWTNDDFMTSGKTQSNGCVTLNYQTKDSWWCTSWWDPCSNPDIFCEVSGDCLVPKDTHTMNNKNQDHIANFGTIYMDRAEEFCHDGTWNGCGPSVFPDSLTDLADNISGFSDICNLHDVCYSNCGKPRVECENEFLSRMYADCDGDWWCEFLAESFYTAVYYAGEGSCLESRQMRGCTAAEVDSCYI